MHHSSLPISALNLSSHIEKAIDLAMHVPIGLVPAILAPFAREDAFSGRVGGHRGDGRVADEWELAFLI